MKTITLSVIKEFNTSGGKFFILQNHNITHRSLMREFGCDQANIALVSLLTTLAKCCC